jgi:hypothetical protein
MFLKAIFPKKTKKSIYKNDFNAFFATFCKNMRASKIKKVTIKNRLISLTFQPYFLQFVQATVLIQGLDYLKNHLQAKVFPTSLNM